MPEKRNIKDMFVDKFSIESGVYEPVSGREIYDEMGTTMLNKRPVFDFKAHILQGYNTEDIDDDLPFTPTELCEALLIDGSIGLYIFDSTVLFMDNLIVINQGNAFDWINKDSDNPIFRTYHLGTDEEGKMIWFITEWENYDTDDAKISEEYTLEFEQIYLFPNGRGILFNPQRMYKRLEEIDAIIKEQTKKENLKTIVTGYTGNITQAKKEFAKDNRIVFMDGDNVKVIEVSSPEMVAKLMDEQLYKEPRYLKSCHIADISDVGNISGISRKYILTPQTSFIQTTRQQMKEIYIDFGYKITFSKNIVDEIDERQKEYNLLKMALADGAINQETFNLKVEHII